MNPYGISPTPLDLAAIAEYTAGVLYAREQYMAEQQPDPTAEHARRAEAQKRYRDRQKEKAK